MKLLILPYLFVSEFLHISAFPGIYNGYVFLSSETSRLKSLKHQFLQVIFHLLARGSEDFVVNRLLRYFVTFSNDSSFLNYFERVSIVS